MLARRQASHRSRAVTLNPITTLKWSAFVGAVLWGGGMIWWIGSFDLTAIIIFSIGSFLFGFGWYAGMRFIFEGLRLLPKGGAGNTPRSKFHVWTVWAGAMLLTGLSTVWLLSLVTPLIPPGDRHELIRQIFVVVTWPSLMWSLRPLIKRHLPG
jgi:hypothetical protein